MKAIHLHSLPKPTFLALYAAVGCLLAALIAEGFLLLTRQRVENPVLHGPQAICLTIDVSASMAGEKFNEVKAAASRFVERRDLSRDRIALVSFHGQARQVVALTRDENAILNAIRSLSLGDGGTNFEDAVYYSEQELSSTSEPSAVLLFTDGQSTVGNPYAAVNRAEQMRKRGIRFYAIATSDADRSYLARLTGKRGHVIPATVGDFDAAFRKAEQMMFGGQLMESADSDLYGSYSFWQAILRVSVWTSFLCLGIGGSLVVGQNIRLKKPALTRNQAAIVIGGSIVAGLVAGLVGQLLYAGLSIIPFLSFLGRLIAWAILGAILARGMALFIPNFNIEWAWRGGAIGGVLGAIGFLFLSEATGDIGGRLAGATLLGLCIGLMVGLVEIACREAWLTVVYGRGETTNVNLGVVPVSLGSGAQDTVYLPGAGERVYTFRLESGQVHCSESGKTDRIVQPGDRFTAGSAEIVVCTPNSPYVPAPPPNAPPTRHPSVEQANTEQRLPESVPAPLRLMLSSGNTVQLVAGSVIRAGEIPGLVPGSSERAIGRVTAHPKKPGLLGLVNLSTTSWTVQSEDGRETRIAPGIAVPLRAGLSFTFGTVSGKVV